MKLTFKFKNTDGLSIGLPVYKDDTELGKIFAINEETKEVVVDIDPMFSNWIREMASRRESIGISTKKQPRRL